jgi:hypothetical protein
MPFKSGSLAGREISCDNKGFSGSKLDAEEKENKRGGSWFDWWF